MTLISGPNVSVPWAVSVDSNNGSFINLNGAIPNVGDTYQFTGTYSDGSALSLTASVTAVLNSFVTGMTVQTTSPGSVTVPQFNWVTPSLRHRRPTPISWAYFPRVDRGTFNGTIMAATTAMASRAARPMYCSTRTAAQTATARPFHPYRRRRTIHGMSACRMPTGIVHRNQPITTYRSRMRRTGIPTRL